MTDDMQRARELLAAHIADLRAAAKIFRTDLPALSSLAAEFEKAAEEMEAVAAALRAAPEEENNDAIERAAKALHANGADSMTSDTPWSELHDGEVNQFRSWARAALVAARPQGVKDAD